MTIFEIDQQIADFPFETDENGEITNLDAFDALQMAREEKLENTALYVKELLAESAAIKAEIISMTERVKSKERKAESLKQYLAFALNCECFESPKVKVSYRKTEAVEVKDVFVEWARKNAPQYVRTKIEESPDKNEIKQALKSGQEIPFVELVENKNLVLK